MSRLRARMWSILLACSPDPEGRGDPGPPPTLAERCFGTPREAAGAVPDYEAWAELVPAHCAGTGQQAIGDVDRVVFVGDSITFGTPPTPIEGWYRELVVADLAAALGHPVEAENCSEWGARVDDLVRDDDQLARCLGDDPVGSAPIDERETLLVFTVGGNDLFAFAEDLQAGGTTAALDRQVDEAIALLDEALDYVDAQRARFPNGLHVVFGNVYEYTDGTGDLGLCPMAETLGFADPVPEIRDAYVRVNEAWVRLAVEHGDDVVFLLEHFCGHGFRHGDPSNECFRGEDAALWFDPTCIHPNPEGHRVIADLLLAVITNGPKPAAITPILAR